MDLTTGILVLVLILAAGYWWKYGKGFRPPGPINWFGLGGLIAVHKANPTYPHLAFAKLAEKYGDILYIKLGVNPTVMISRYEDIIEIFTKDEFQNRYEFPYTKDRAFNKELGIVFTSNEVWRDVRYFSQKRLRDFGFRSSAVLETLIQEELITFMDSLETKLQKRSGLFRMENAFTITVINILWNLTFGFKSIECEELLQRMLNINKELMQVFTHGDINQAFPILRKIIPGQTGHKRHMEIFEENQKIFMELIAESEKRQTNSDDPFNFVQAFQQKIKKSAVDIKTNFTEQQLLITLIDLFVAGSETTNHFLGFAILHLVLQPEIQKKIQDEIDKEFPNEKLLSYTAAERLPYTMAVLYEIFRFCNIAPIPVPRRASRDYPYKGFIIPKGSCVMYNLHCVFNDPDYWGDPQEFRPSRFLDSSTGKLVRTERVAVFGFGKRVCIGDVLSKQTAFAYLTGLLKRFNFSQVPGQGPPSAVPLSCFTSKPKPFDVLITLRN